MKSFAITPLASFKIDFAFLPSSCKLEGFPKQPKAERNRSMTTGSTGVEALLSK